MIDHDRLCSRVFFEWLDRQSPERQFDYTEPSGCMIACWLREAAVATDCRVSSNHISHGTLCERLWFPAWLEEIADALVGLKVLFTVQEAREVLSQPDLCL